jgi:hypothetical protein
MPPVKITIFWDVTPCVVWKCISVSEESVGSILRLKKRRQQVLPKRSVPICYLHGVTSQKTILLIFTSVILLVAWKAGNFVIS